MAFYISQSYVCLMLCIAFILLSVSAPALISHHIAGLRHLQRYSSSGCYLCFLGENISRFRTQPSFSEGLRN
ncbi:hypothetical protein P8452_59756 [Trifolium repens]|nr:hypothetical protein P8452_59756 [Trifolium repens]